MQHIHVLEGSCYQEQNVFNSHEHLMTMYSIFLGYKLCFCIFLFFMSITNIVILILFHLFHRGK